MAIEHGAVRANAEPMRGAVDFDPVFARQLLVSDGHSHALAKDLRAASRQGIEPSFVQCDQYILDRHLVDASNMSDLDSGEGLDMDVRVSRLQTAKHLAVVLEAPLHVESANDVKFLRQPVRRGLCLSVDLIERVMVSPIFLRQ